MNLFRFSNDLLHAFMSHTLKGFCWTKLNPCAPIPYAFTQHLYVLCFYLPCLQADPVVVAWNLTFGSDNECWRFVPFQVSISKRACLSFSEVQAVSIEVITIIGIMYACSSLHSSLLAVFFLSVIAWTLTGFMWISMWWVTCKTMTVERELGFGSLC